MSAIDRVAAVQSVLSWYERSTQDQRAEGRAWYADQREIVRLLAQRHGVSAECVAAVVSALSPQTRWSANIAGAARLLAAWSAGETAAPRNATLYYKNAEKAWRILTGEVSADAAFKNGPKTRAFWRNLSGDETAVTVDVWMARALALDTSKFASGIKPNVYRECAEAVAEAARIVGEPPAQFQAIVWVTVRGQDIADDAVENALLSELREDSVPYLRAI